MARKNEFGQNWWANRFNQTLEKMGWADRLQRGRSYARKGAVLEIKMNEKGVRSLVQGSRSHPYEVEISFQPLTLEDWDQLLNAMAERAVFTASLLSGEMPAEIESILANSAVTLFPTAGSDIHAYCSCPDGANPCKHVAAVYYMLGQRFDDDPFLLFELRGLTRSEMLKQLAEKRRLINEQEKEAAAYSSNQTNKKSGSRKSVNAIVSTTARPGMIGNTIDFRQTLIQSGANETLNAKGPGYWKAGYLPEHLPNWQIPPVPALLLQSHNPPTDWRGPDFMDTMTAIYHNSSLNAIRYLQKSEILTSSDDKRETNNS